MSKTRSKKKTPHGRPLGSPNRDYPVVEVDAPRCRSAGCDSTKFRVLKRLPDQPYNGTHNGTPYTTIERRRVACAECGAVMMFVSYV